MDGDDGGDDSGDGGGDRSGGDNDVCNYEDGSSGLTAMEEVVEVKVMATEEVITKVQMSVVVEVVERSNSDEGDSKSGGEMRQKRW